MSIRLKTQEHPSRGRPPVYKISKSSRNRRIMHTPNSNVCRNHLEACNSAIARWLSCFSSWWHLLQSEEIALAGVCLVLFLRFWFVDVSRWRWMSPAPNFLAPVEKTTEKVAVYLVNICMWWIQYNVLF